MRLPAHLEVAALIRLAEAGGGFAAVLHKGEREAGTVLVSLTDRGGPARLFERLPMADGRRLWSLARAEDPDDRQAYADYLARRVRQDADVWVVELDIAEGERLIGFQPEGR
jgi:hypothetical protein